MEQQIAHFGFNPLTSLPFPIDIRNIVEKDSQYYIAGSKETNDFRFFITRLNQNGTMNSTFNCYLENDSNLNYIEDMIVNSDNIIVAGNNRIVKYLQNNLVLSETYLLEKNNLSFENPVKQNLIFNSKEKIRKI